MSKIQNKIINEIRDEKSLLEQQLEELKNRQRQDLIKKLDLEIDLIAEITNLSLDDRFKRISHNPEYSSDVEEIKLILIDDNRFIVTKSIQKLKEYKCKMEDWIMIQQKFDDNNIAWIKKNIEKKIFASLEHHLTDSSFLDYIDKTKKNK